MKVFEFEKLCGRKITGFSLNKSCDLPMSTTAALTLSIRLRERANDELSRHLQPTARQLSGMLMDWVVEQSKANR